LATHASAIKRARQNEKKRQRNLHVKTTVKSSIKRVRTAIDEKNPEAAQKALREAIPLIMRARSKGVYHRKNSARKISRLAQQVNTLKAQ
jgi:small subunit ribosomal protein S20